MLTIVCFRHWSKKYPICIALSKEQLSFEPEAVLKLDVEEEKEKEEKQPAEKEKPKTPTQKEKKVFSRFRKREYPVLVISFVV